MCVWVRVPVAVLLNILSFLISALYIYIATMVIKMSSGQLGRYKEEAKTDMIRCNRR